MWVKTQKRKNGDQILINLDNVICIDIESLNNKEYSIRCRYSDNRVTYLAQYSDKQKAEIALDNLFLRIANKNNVYEFKEETK